MLSEEVMQKAKKAADKLLRFYDFKTYRKDIAAIARESLKDPSVVDFRKFSRSVRNVPTFIKILSRHMSWCISTVASEHLSLCREARERTSFYPKFCRSVDRHLEVSRDLPLVRDWFIKGSRLSRRDASDMVAVLARFMSRYELRISYLAGLVTLLEKSPLTMKWLYRRPTRKLERMLREHRKEPLLELILREEYRHLRDVISERGYRFTPGERKLTFSIGGEGRTFHWRREYTYRGFAEVVLGVAEWECGWVLGRAVEKVELGLFEKARSIEMARLDDIHRELDE